MACEQHNSVRCAPISCTPAIWGGLPKATFAVETSQGTAVTVSDSRFAYFEEFVAICNAHTPQLPYIWEHHQRPHT
jgi:hypothetical protein